MTAAVLLWVSERDVLLAMSARTGLSLEAVERHTDTRCRSIKFHPFIWRVVTECRLPQALVTVNPDLFVNRVATRYRLTDQFETIVVSCSEGSADESTICELALDRLGFSGARADALLIDNRADLADAWRLAGGASYVYRGDESFEADLPTLLG
jgi:hypothetical protein